MKEDQETRQGQCSVKVGQGMREGKGWDGMGWEGIVAVAVAGE